MNKSKVIDALNGVKAQDSDLGLPMLASQIEKRYDANKRERNEILDYKQEESNKVRKYWLKFKDDKDKVEEIKACQDFIKRMQRLI